MRSVGADLLEASRSEAAQSDPKMEGVSELPRGQLSESASQRFHCSTRLTRRGLSSVQWLESAQSRIPPGRLHCCFAPTFPGQLPIYALRRPLWKNIEHDDYFSRPRVGSPGSGTRNPRDRPSPARTQGMGRPRRFARIAVKGCAETSAHRVPARHPFVSSLSPGHSGVPTFRNPDGGGLGMVVCSDQE